MAFQEVIELVKDVWGFEVSKEGQFTAADCKAMAVWIGVNSILVVFVLECNDCVAHAEPKEVQAFVEQLLSTSTYLPLAKVCRLYYIGRYSKFF